MLKRFSIRDGNQIPVSFAYFPSIIKAMDDDIYTLMAIRQALPYKYAAPAHYVVRRPCFKFVVPDEV